MRLGEEWPAKHNLDSLRILGSVGEPINPEAWMWYYKNIGHENCPIVDTWWQTETGGFMITPLPGAHTLKPGSASRPSLASTPCCCGTTAASAIATRVASSASGGPGPA